MTAALIILAAAAGGAVVAALVGWAVSEWIDRAPESAEGPRCGAGAPCGGRPAHRAAAGRCWDRDYRPMLPRCSYQSCGAESAGTVAEFELCREHLDALLPQSATPTWV